MALGAALVSGNNVDEARDTGEEGMEEVGGEEGGGDEVTEDDVEVLNMSSSVLCLAFIVT